MLTPPYLYLQGITQAARYIHRRLVSDGILSQAFSVAPVRLLIFYFLFLSRSRLPSSGPQLPLSPRSTGSFWWGTAWERALRPW